MGCSGKGLFSLQPLWPPSPQQQPRPISTPSSKVGLLVFAVLRPRWALSSRSTATTKELSSSMPRWPLGSQSPPSPHPTDLHRTSPGAPPLKQRRNVHRQQPPPSTLRWQRNCGFVQPDRSTRSCTSQMRPALGEQPLGQGPSGCPLPTWKERENNRCRERLRRGIAAKILAGLRRCVNVVL